MPKPRFVPTVVALMIAAASLCPSGAVRAQVPVRHAEGVVHGFLVLRDTDGRALADSDDHGQPKVESEQMKLPPDLANGLVLTLLKNARPDALPGSVGFIAATPKPRLVKLALSTAGEESFSTGGTPRKATHYVLKVEIGGISGLVQSTSSSGAPAGPEMTSPFGLKREPWQGQSHVRSAVFHATVQPMWVQIADRIVTAPAGSRYAATFAPFRSRTLPCPRLTSRSERPSAPAKRSRIM